VMIGYARVSTEERSLAVQLDALRGAGWREIFRIQAREDGSRKGMAAVLPATCWLFGKRDRLGRSLALLVGSVETLQGMDAAEGATARARLSTRRSRKAVHSRRVRRPGGVRAGIDQRAD
jgi:hypothetical protein